LSKRSNSCKCNSYWWFLCSKTTAEVIKNGGYDLVIAGKESLDYNGGMVPGMIAGILDTTSKFLYRHNDWRYNCKWNWWWKSVQTTTLIIGGQKD
jgi:electron transfer flavoprotein beta subunit